MKHEMNEFQLNIISSYVYAYLKSYEDFIHAKSHDMKLEQRCERNLFSLSEILSVFLGRAIKPEHDFLDISTSLDKKEFSHRVREVVEAF